MSKLAAYNISIVDLHTQANYVPFSSFPANVINPLIHADLLNLFFEAGFSMGGRLHVTLTREDAIMLLTDLCNFLKVEVVNQVPDPGLTSFHTLGPEYIPQQPGRQEPTGPKTPKDQYESASPTGRFKASPPEWQTLPRGLTKAEREDLEFIEGTERDLSQNSPPSDSPEAPEKPDDKEPA